MQTWFEMTGHLKWLEQFAIQVGSAQKGGLGATHKGRLVKCQKGVLMSKFVIVYYCQKADIKSKKCLEMAAGMKIWQIEVILCKLPHIMELIIINYNQA